MIKKITQRNAIPPLLSRVNKAKVYRGWEHEPRESPKSGERSPAWIGCPCREETNASGHGAGKGSTVQHNTPSAQLDYLKFCL